MEYDDLFGEIECSGCCIDFMFVPEDTGEERILVDGEYKPVIMVECFNCGEKMIITESDGLVTIAISHASTESTLL